MLNELTVITDEQQSNNLYKSLRPRKKSKDINPDGVGERVNKKLQDPVKRTQTVHVKADSTNVCYLYQGYHLDVILRN